MSYEKQTWANGDIITANKLNHIEDGIENSEKNTLIVNVDATQNPITADKTYDELLSALQNGVAITAIVKNSEYDVDYDMDYTYYYNMSNAYYDSATLRIDFFNYIIGEASNNNIGITKYLLQITRQNDIYWYINEYSISSGK